MEYEYERVTCKLYSVYNIQHFIYQQIFNISKVKQFIIFSNIDNNKQYVVTAAHRKMLESLRKFP